MNGAVAAGVVSLAVVVLGSVVLVTTAPRWPEPRLLRGAKARSAAAVDAAVPHVGRAFLAATVALASFSVTLITCWFLGKLAHALEPRVDVPMFAWFQERQLDGTWHALWSELTLMGNRAQTQRIVVVGAIVLAVAWRKRGFWIPLLALPAGYMFEKFGQMLLSKSVNRGHPPTTLGTWVSGGCARLIIVYGLVIFLVLAWLGVRRRWWVAGWCLLGLLAATEAYSRTYLLKHWFTDVVGGVIYGTMLLLFMIAAVKVLDRAVIARRAAGNNPDELGAEDLPQSHVTIH